MAWRSACILASEPTVCPAPRSIPDQVCIHTSAEPPSAGTARPVCVELLGSGGSTGTIRLDAVAVSNSAGPCFVPGSSVVFQLEAPAVGELRQLNIWVDGEGASAWGGGELWAAVERLRDRMTGRDMASYDACCTQLLRQSRPPSVLSCPHLPCPAAAPSEAAWHLDTIEVACKAGGPTARPAYFVCRRWLDERCGFRAELAASARNPRQEEVDYKVG